MVITTLDNEQPLSTDLGSQTNIVPGTTILVVETFKDKQGFPLIPATGYPICYLQQGDTLVTTALGYQTANSTATEWNANLIVPAEFDLGGKSEVPVIIGWEFETVGGSNYNPTIMATVISPTIGSGDDDQVDVIELAPITNIKIKVPFIVRQDVDTAVFELYYDNELVGSANSDSSTIEGSRSRLSFTISIQDAFVSPLSGVLRLTINGASRMLSIRVFSMSPSMLEAMSSLNQSINKANQIEAIQALQYRECDLLEAMHRGLDMFNSFGPTITGFTGTNMQGPIRESWLLCSTIAALRAQSMAESMFAFDFSGQAISLNVDRAQAIETALGHYESVRDNELSKFKKLLGIKGVISGDGHQGRDLTRYAHMGITMLSNTAITRGRLAGGYPYNTVNGRWF